MRFEPKIVEADEGWEDETDELPLAGGLAELGAQLHEDAQYLSRLYPPEAENSRQRHAAETSAAHLDTTRRRRTTPWLATAVSLASLALLAVGITNHQPSDVVPEPIPSTASSSDAPLAPRMPRISSTAVLNTESPADNGSFVFLPGSSVQHSPTPTLLPRDASMLQTGGPQAEAYLDYIEMTTVRNVKLSL